ncbi:MAG: hypothetical protein HKO06_09175, partial [Pseudomonadales bacterium]|nr:hypothetical protein [Pseudomonadales bacterium]
MSFTAQDIQAKIQELLADGSMFVMQDMDINGKRYRGFTHAAPNMLEMLQ